MCAGWLAGWAESIKREVSSTARSASGQHNTLSVYAESTGTVAEQLSDCGSDQTVGEYGQTWRRRFNTCSSKSHSCVDCDLGWPNEVCVAQRERWQLQ